MYDLLVLGDDPAGLATARRAARHGLSVGLVCPPVDALQTSTFLSEALRDLVPELAVDVLRGAQHARRHAGAFSLGDLRQLLIPRVDYVAETLFERFRSIGTDVFKGHARFLDERAVEVAGENTAAILRAENFVVATGAAFGTAQRSERLSGLVMTADQILGTGQAPRRLIVVGADECAIEFAGLFAVSGSRVTLVDGSVAIETTDDSELDTLIDVAMAMGVNFQLGASVVGIDHVSGQSQPLVDVHLDSGSRLRADRVLMTNKRLGRTRGLNLSAAGLVTDDCYRLWCDHQHRTWQHHIFGVGEVVGFAPRDLDPMAQAKAVVDAIVHSQRVPAPLGIRRSLGASSIRITRP